jgi:hypothetical protein
MTFVWTESEKAVDRVELAEIYRPAPLGEKPPASLRTVFSNSMFKCFVYSDGRLIGAGRDRHGQRSQEDPFATPIPEQKASTSPSAGSP